MKFLHRLILALCLFLCPFMVLAEKPITYLSQIPDVPLMEELMEAPDSTISFDKPEGRIVSTYTIMDADIPPERVYDFYKTTLPQLGWKIMPDGLYVRDAEQLNIIIEAEMDAQIVQFLLMPLEK